MTSTRTRAVALALAAIATIGLAACTSGGAGGGTTGGRTQITVVDAPVAGTAPLWVALEQGFLEDNGLDVELLPPSASSESTVPVIVSGSADLGMIGAATVLQAAGQGITVRVIAGLSRYAETAEEDGSGIFVRADSGLTLADFGAGTKLGVLGVSSQSTLATKTAIERAGGDPGAVEYLQVPYDSMQSMIERGDIDGGLMTEPRFTSALQNPALTQISSPLSEGAPGLAEIIIFSSKTWLDENAAVVEPLRKALASAVEWIHDPGNEDELVKIIAEHTGLEPNTVNEMRRSVVRAELTIADLEAVEEFARSYDTITAPIDLEEILAP